MGTLKFIPSIHVQILKVEERMHLRLNTHLADLSQAVDQLLASGGKRIRPAISLLTGTMLGAESDRLIALGAAIELLHTATLVHDDLIDGALVRRGIATLNSKWTPAATVLTGDYIFAQAAKLAAETESIILMHRFSETLATIVNGELKQMFTTHSLPSREEYYQRIYAKTASLFELATEAAAQLSPVDETIIAMMRKIGFNIGMAFQIVDDVLDFTGEQLTIGKPVASDLRQGLITLPALYYYEMNNGNSEMQSVIKGQSQETIDFDILVKKIKKSGAIDLALDEAKKFINSALLSLAEQPSSEEKTNLEDIALYIINRTV